MPYSAAASISRSAISWAFAISSAAGSFLMNPRVGIRSLRAATAFRQYAAAQRQAERYRTAILPAAAAAYRINLAGFKGGQFEYLRVLQTQRAAAETNLEYVRVLAEQWRAGSEIAGLLQEECWPPPAQIASDR